MTICGDRTSVARATLATARVKSRARSHYRTSLPWPSAFGGKMAQRILSDAEKSSLYRRLMSRRFITARGCWEWTGAYRQSTGGYGEMRAGGHRDGFTIRVHRAMALVAFGDLQGKHVLHTCDNPLCFNPDHLYLGTPLDNARDREDRNPSDMRGSRNPNSRLTEASVKQIREHHRNGGAPGTIAKLFAISGSQVARIVSRRRWSHVM